MNKKPTPGPWKAVCVGDSGGENPIDVYEVTTANDHVRICEHLYAADAQLVAAAPDLLAALKDCVLVMRNELNGLAVIQPEMRQAIRAIEQATGDEA